MFKTTQRTLKRIFKWAANQKYRQPRRLSDYRATNLAVKLTLSGSLAPHRAISSYTKN
jgi:hypothetical protein